MLLHLWWRLQSSERSVSTSKGQLRWPHFGTPSIPVVQGPLRKRIKINLDIPVGVLNLRPPHVSPGKVQGGHGSSWYLEWPTSIPTASRQRRHGKKQEGVASRSNRSKEGGASSCRPARETAEAEGGCQEHRATVLQRDRLCWREQPTDQFIVYFITLGCWASGQGSYFRQRS